MKKPSKTRARHAHFFYSNPCFGSQTLFIGQLEMEA